MVAISDIIPPKRTPALEGFSQSGFQESRMVSILRAFVPRDTASSGSGNQSTPVARRHRPASRIRRRSPVLCINRGRINSHLPVTIVPRQTDRRPPQRMRPPTGQYRNTCESTPQSRVPAAQCGARTRACRIDTRVDTCQNHRSTDRRREESRRGTHECVRNVKPQNKKPVILSSEATEGSAVCLSRPARRTADSSLRSE